jgi:hypothetical protein
VALPLAVQAQEDDNEDIFELSPFSIEASEVDGYMAQTTLAGSRIRSNVRDLGASIAIITQEFMEDTGATDGESLLMFVGNVEVAGCSVISPMLIPTIPVPKNPGSIRSEVNGYAVWLAPI